MAKTATTAAKISHTVLRVLWIVIIAAVLIAGILVYTYMSTDPASAPDIHVALNDAPLSYNSLTWHTAVFDGLVYKNYNETVGKLDADALPELNAPTLLFSVPDGYDVAAIVRDSSGQALSPAANDPFRFTAVKNGRHTYDITVTLPQARGESYGEWHYTGSFHVQVEPQINFSSTAVAQGDVVTVQVTGMDDTPEPTLEQSLSYTRFARRGTNWYAEIGVGYNVTPGDYVLSVSCGEKNVTETLRVSAREFSRQDMTIDSGTIAETNTADAYVQWREAIWTLYDTGDDTVYWEGQFQPPVTNTTLNTEYGLFRYTNGSSTPDRHGGVDFDCDEGDPVYAPNNGRVAYAGFLTLTGNTVVIEHGAGLKTYYFHMSELACAKDDMVKTGDLIGKVGSTGYSTGPHMHFEAKIGRQSIDPMRLLDGTSGLYLAS